MVSKPLIWLPFAAGGTLAAFVLPALMFAVLLATSGAWPADVLAFERVSAFAAHPAGAIALLVVLGLPLWHAAHRLRMTLQDLGVRGARARTAVARVCYGTAAVVTLTMIYALGRLT